jgi:membrane protein required for colicin V production
MTGFDILAMVVVGFGATRGFMRGFVQEFIALMAWIVALLCIHTLYTPLAAYLEPHVHTSSGASVLAFLLLLAVPYGAARLLASWLGNASRHSVLGPLDRVLGFGFGAVKGTVIIVLAFSVLVLGYDTVWGAGGRPEWLTKSRTYPFVNASSEALVKALGKRREEAAAAAAEPSDAPSPEATAPAHSHHKHKRAAE